MNKNPRLHLQKILHNYLNMAVLIVAIQFVLLLLLLFRIVSRSELFENTFIFEEQNLEPKDFLCNHFHFNLEVPGVDDMFACHACCYLSLTLTQNAIVLRWSKSLFYSEIDVSELIYFIYLFPFFLFYSFIFFLFYSFIYFLSFFYSFIFT